MSGAPFTVLDGDSEPVDAFIIKMMAAGEKKALEGVSRFDWCCRHCDSFNSNIAGLKLHLADECVFFAFSSDLAFNST